MNSYSISPLISLTINLSIAIIIFFDNPKDIRNRWFAGFISLFALWNISEIIILNSTNQKNALFAAQILYRIVFLTPAFYVVISYLFPKNIHKITKKALFYFLLFGIPIAILAFSFPHFQIEIVPLISSYSVNYYKISSKFSLPFLLLIFISIIYFTWGSYILYQKNKLLKTIQEKNQLRFFLFGFIAFIIGFFLINAFRNEIVNVFHIPFYYLANTLTFLISIFFLISVVHFKVLNTKLIRKGIIYSFLSSLVLLFYILLVISINSIINSSLGINSLIISGIILIVLVFLIRPLEIRIQKIIDRKINKDIVAYKKNFLIFNKEIEEYLSQKKFLSKVKKFLIENYMPEDVFIFVFNPKTQKFIDIENNNLLEINEEQYVINLLKEEHKPVEFYSLDFSRLDEILLESLLQENISLILPLGIKKELNAIIFLSEKLNGKTYTDENLDSLNIFRNEISIVLQRNLMIKAERIKAIEKYRLEKLAALGQLTAGIAHEIRNPLNTISTSAQTLQRRNISDDSKKELLSFITDEVKRLQNLLNDFLKLSKINKLNPEFFNIDDISSVIQQNFDAKNQRNINFNINIKLDQREIYSDFNSLYQILLNLILNSYDAIIEKCTNNFDCAKAYINLEISDNFEEIIFLITDNGIGIKTENIDAIFNPFFTTKEEGTGLGLAIVNNLVDSLNGKIELSSGEETCFTISIPKKIKND